MNKIYVTLFFDYEGKWSRPDQENSSRKGIEHILGKLEQAGIQATFNCVGRLVNDQQDMFEQINQSGHEIASHTVGHTLVKDWSVGQMASDIVKFRELLHPITKNIVGFRSPQSKWRFKTLQALLKSGILWDAADDQAPFPYVILQKGKHRLWRMPTRTDDWYFEKSDIKPSTMLESWREVVLSAIRQRQYVAVGFHPWVLGKDNSRLVAFSEFVDFLCGRENIVIAPFGDIARLCETGIMAEKSA